MFLLFSPFFFGAAVVTALGPGLIHSQNVRAMEACNFRVGVCVCVCRPADTLVVVSRRRKDGGWLLLVLLVKHWHLVTQHRFDAHSTVRLDSHTLSLDLCSFCPCALGTFSFPLVWLSQLLSLFPSTLGFDFDFDCAASASRSCCVPFVCFHP